MRIWNDFANAIGQQFQSLKQHWHLKAPSLPSHDHIAEEERVFFDRRYTDFLQRAHDGEALLVTYSRFEPDGEDGANYSALSIYSGSPLPSSDIQKEIEPNERYLKEFQRFLRSFDFTLEQTDQALAYAQALSKATMPEREAEFKERRAAFKKSMLNNTPDAP